MSEIWKPVVGYEGIYEVSSHARVRRVRAGQGTRSGHILSPVVGKKGYLQVKLLRKVTRIHRIVAMAFLGESDLPLVRHLDGNPANNIPSNLAWGTSQDNTDDRVRHGRTTYAGSSKLATHCKWGHEYTPENTRYEVKKNCHRPARRCRECARNDNRRSYQRRKAQ
jgi:hypothetical protein